MVSNNPMIKSLKIGARPVGPGRPCFIIAEAGVNHDGDVKIALRLVDAAAEAGADAVKFQTFRAERMASAAAFKAAYQKRQAPARQSQLEMLKSLELSETAHRQIIARCRKHSLLFLSPPFDDLSADFLESLNVPAFKIPSGELTNWPLLSHIARKDRPMIVSTGMSYLKEIREALAVIRKAGNPPVILLHCVSNYPAHPATANLRAMKTLEDAFSLPIGFSDHAQGLEVSLAAAALGAAVLEKHFTLDKNRRGPDHFFSLEPRELEAWVKGIRVVESALGHGRKEPAAGELEIAAVARKSLVAARFIPAGARLTANAIAVKRPGTGIPPSQLPKLLGRKTSRDIPPDLLLSWDMLKLR